MFIQGSRIYDTRYDRHGVVDSVESKPKGILYRVQFENGKWGSYYENTIEARFTAAGPTVEETETIAEQLDDSNVVFTNFNTREKFVDRSSWEYWLNMRRIG